MDVIINLVVTVAIVLFILRRMQEVAQKGRDITAPPVQRPMFGDDEEMADEETAPSRRSYPATEETIPFPRRFAIPEDEPAPRQWSPPPVPTMRRIRVTDEDLLEQAETTLSASPVNRQRQGVGRPAMVESGLPSGEDGGPNGIRPEYVGILFGRQGLIQGIVMREILGPPVGLRSTPGGIGS